MHTEQNTLYPVFLKLDQVPVLIVGGGAVALEKLSFLLKSSPNAKVTLVAPHFLPELETLAAEHGCQMLNRAFQPQDLGRCRILLVATNEASVNAEVAALGKATGLLVNVADTPALCDFYLGGIVSKGPVKIGISTMGQSPTLAKRLRQYLEELLPDDITTLSQQLSELKGRLHNADFAQKVQALNALTAELLAAESAGCGTAGCPFQKERG